jgi:hypothetical protein
MRIAHLAATTGLVLLVLATVAAATFSGQQQLRSGHYFAHHKHLTTLQHHLGAAQRGFKQQKATLVRTFGAQQANVSTNQTNSTTAPPATSSALLCLIQRQNISSRLDAKCGSSEDVSVLVDPSNNTQQATNAINRFCSQTCQDEINAIRREYPGCLTDEHRMVFDVLTISCQRINGTTCAQRIRAFDQLNCSDLNEASCSSTANKSCAWMTDINGDRSCEAVPTQASLQELCTPCLDKFMFLFGRLQGADMQRPLIALKDLICVKSGNRYCLPVFNAIDYRTFDIDPANNATLESINANISAACSDGDSKRCMTKVGLATAKVIRFENDNQFRSCLVQTSVSTCVNNWVAAERAAVQVEKALAFTCATNDAGLRCMSEFHTFIRHPCQQQFKTSACNATCGQVVTNFTARAGCCLDKYHRVAAQAINPARIPTNKGAAPPAGNLTWETNPMREINDLCANATGFNETSNRNMSSTPCAGASNAVRKELPLRGLLWAQIRSNTAFQAKLIYSLQTDLASAIGCLVEQIVNLTLSEDTAQALNASVQPRRQGNASTGTKASFSVSGDNNADATANSNAYDAGRSTLTLPLAAAAIQEDCSDCVAPPTAAPGQTPAPFSASDLFASLTGADAAISSNTTAAPSGGSGGGGDSSSSSTVVVAWAVVAATVVTVFFMAA